MDVSQHRGETVVPFTQVTTEDMDGEWIEGRIFPGCRLTVRAPSAFFDPLTGCLITEPVKLTNALMPQPRTFDRKTLQQWWIKCAGALPRLEVN